VNAALASAARIGYLAAESNAKGWPLVAFGKHIRAKLQQGNDPSTRAKREKAQALLREIEILTRQYKLSDTAAARRYLAEHEPDWLADRDVVTDLLCQHADPDYIDETLEYIRELQDRSVLECRESTRAHSIAFLRDV
jgi:hypothetical protein